MSSDGSFAFLLPFIFVTFGCLLLLISCWNSPAARRWGIGYLLSAGGFVTPWIFNDVSAELHALAADALFLGAAYCYSEALFLHFGPVRFRRLRLGFLLAIYAATAYSVLVRQSLNDELLFGDIGFACAMMLPLPFVWRLATLRIEKALLVVTILVIADCVIRNVILVGVLPAADGLDTFEGSTYAYVMQVTSSMLGMLLALTAIATVVLRTVASYRNAAERDPLTGLLNRSGFERAAAALAPDEAYNAAVIVADLDHFKAVNDSCGHAKGDVVLAGFAALLGDFLPASALASRFGGEEFVICLPAVTTDDAEYLAETIRRALESRDWTDVAVSKRITVSLGIACLRDGDLSIHDAIARADKALYAAKNAGRNRVAIDDRPIGPPPSLQVAPAA
jgi:diguanylate cyclase (GGDEF)-like protein